MESQEGFHSLREGVIAVVSWQPPMLLGWGSDGINLHPQFRAFLADLHVVIKDSNAACIPGKVTFATRPHLFPAGGCPHFLAMSFLTYVLFDLPVPAVRAHPGQQPDICFSKQLPQGILVGLGDTMVDPPRYRRQNPKLLQKRKPQKTKRKNEKEGTKTGIIRQEKQTER